MVVKKRILLKLTGELLLSTDKQRLNTHMLISVVQQIQKLAHTYEFGIVIGGGNFFRGSQHSQQLNIAPATGHYVGMLATMMNGLILKDIFEQHGLPTCLMSAFTCPEIATPISQQAINNALTNGHVIIFSGGTGNPFFTTDTNAILRALQMEAHEVWKGTNVDGVFSADPKKVVDAQLLKTISFEDALQYRYGILDATAFIMASEHRMPIRVFNIFTPDALHHAAANTSFGTIIT